MKLEENQCEKVVQPLKLYLKNLISTPNISSIDHTNPIDYVLHLITNKAMTSRDIQITLKKVENILQD